MLVKPHSRVYRKTLYNISRQKIFLEKSKGTQQHEPRQQDYMKKILELATRPKEQKLYKHEGTGQSTHPELARVMTK